MKLSAKINGHLHEFELRSEGDGWIVDGKESTVLEVESGIYSILLEGRSYDVRVARGMDGLVAMIGGHRFAVEIEDPRQLSRKSGHLRLEGCQKVTASMPGKVVRVLVKEGEAVEQGQGLIVIEAMKMQNEMKAPRPGKLVSIPVGEGATVAAGQVLAVIE
jgi:biotin carboxyl carrier protein